MMTPTPRLMTAAVLLALVSAPVAFAQTPSGTATAQTQAPRWALSLGAQETWDNWVRLDEPSGRLATRLTAELEHTRRGRRGALTLGGWGSGWFYQGAGGSELTYEGSLSGDFRFGSRLRMSVAEAYRTDYTDEDPLFLAEGTVLPRVVSHTNNAQLDLTFALSPRTQISGGIRQELVNFDTEALVGRSNVGVVGDFRRQVTRTGSAVLEYFGEMRSAEGQWGQSHRASIGWEQARTGRAGGHAALGAMRLTRLDTGEAHVEPYGSASAWLRGRAGMLTLRYEHGVALSYTSVREQRTDMASLAATRSLGRHFSASLFSSYSVRQDLGDTEAEDFHMQRYGAGLAFDGGKGLTVGVDYSYYRYAENEAGPARGRHRVSAALQYGRRWR
jgi:opacity protein-like surface antigen